MKKSSNENAKKPNYALAVLLVLICVVFALIGINRDYSSYADMKRLYVFMLILTVFSALFSLVYCFSKKRENGAGWGKEKVWFILILLFGIILRAVCFNRFPAGYSPDELSSGYDAFSLLNFGIDRNGNAFPVYLEAWGSGQNALLAYLLIPFVALFGLSGATVRLPMLIASVCNLVAAYSLVKKLSDKKTALCAMLVLALSPWAVMTGRWALESNLLPSFLLYATCFYVKGVKDKQVWHVVACAFFGLSLYSYAISYLFVPLYVVVLYLRLIAKKQIKWSTLVICGITLFALALPLILFLLVNFGFVSELKIFGVFSVPHLAGFRSGEVHFDISNLKNFLKIVLFQSDGLAYNSLPLVGTFSFALAPFAAIGFNKALRCKGDNGDLRYIVLSWLFVAVFTACFVGGGNINKFNVAWMPIIFLQGLGIAEVVKNGKKYFAVAMAVVLMSAILMGGIYFGKNNQYNKTVSYMFSEGLLEATAFANETANGKEIVVENYWEPYIFALTGTKADVNDFVNSVKYEDENVPYRRTLSFGNFTFKNVTQGDVKENIVYVVRNGTVIEFGDKFNSKTFATFTVFYPKE